MQLKNPYQSIRNMLNNVPKKIIDKYKGTTKVPIGAKHPPQHYKQKDIEIPEDDIIFFDIDPIVPNDSTSICFIGTSGSHKTTLAKTIIYYNTFIPNTKIAILDLKSDVRDWEKCTKKKINPGMLFPQQPDKIDIVSYCPKFAVMTNIKDKNGNFTLSRKNVKVKNLPLIEFSEDNILSTLGFSPIARKIISQFLQENNNDVNQMMKEIDNFSKKSRIKINASTKNNIYTILDHLDRSYFLDKGEIFDLDKEWAEHQSFAMGFNQKMSTFLSVYVHIILTKIAERSNREIGKKERYLVFVDDAKKAFGVPEEKYVSVQTGISSLTEWRSRGINMMFSAQSPEMINEEIYGDVKHFFIYKTSHIGELSKYIPEKHLRDRIKRLDFRPSEHIASCMWIPPDHNKAVVFYPFNSPIAN